MKRANFKNSNEGNVLSFKQRLIINKYEVIKMTYFFLGRRQLFYRKCDDKLVKINKLSYVSFRLQIL